MAKSITIGRLKITDTGSQIDIVINGNIRAVINDAGMMTLGATDGVPATDLFTENIRANGDCFINADGVSPSAQFYVKNTQSQELIFTPTAGLEIVGTKSYIKLTPLTTTQRDALTPSNGMLIPNSTTGKWQGYIGGGWVDLN